MLHKKHSGQKMIEEHKKCAKTLILFTKKSPDKIYLSELFGYLKVSVRQISATKVGKTTVCTAKVGTTKISVIKSCVKKISVTKIRVKKKRTTKISIWID